MSTEPMDILAARLTQARASLAVLSLAAEAESVPTPETVASVAWAVDTLLAQAQEAVAGLQWSG